MLLAMSLDGQTNQEPELAGVPLFPVNPIVWIDQPDDVNAAVAEIARQKAVGLDVETTLEDPPRLCTIQIGIPSRTYIFDPLRLDDLSAVHRILTDPAIVKIVHYAPFEQGVFHNLQVEIGPVFDTFEASKKLRGEMTRWDHGLDAVCRRELGRPMDKAYQKSHWLRRPLSPGQIRYAALDAEIMLVLYEKFSRELKGLTGSNLE
jgi:ribonuclease D